MVEETSRDTTTTKKVLSYQIIDNFLDTHEFDFLQTKVMEQEHSWYYERVLQMSQSMRMKHTSCIFTTWICQKKLSLN